MGQVSLSDAEYAGKRKKTCREVFLGEMELVVPWKALLKLIEPRYAVAGPGADRTLSNRDRILAATAIQELLDWIHAAVSNRVHHAVDRGPGDR